MDVDTRHLRALIAVVDEGTFTDAAIALRTSQASVSRSVQRLEAAVGRQLLSRSTRHVETTTAGEQVLVHARRIIAAMAQLEVSASSSHPSVRLGYAWAALGEHTVAVQRAWAARELGDLVFEHHNTPTAGLLEGRCEVSLMRRCTADPRLDCTVIGTEQRFAALASDHPLALRPSVGLGDFAGQTMAVDVETGTTDENLWRSGAGPDGFRMTQGVEEWLTLIASGRAVGISSEATAAQHQRHGVTFRPVEDAPTISVWLAWWRASPPEALAALIELCRAAYTAP